MKQYGDIGVFKLPDQQGGIDFMDNLSELAQQLIQFEHDNDLNDNEVAFGSHLSVERIHDIKSSNSAATSEETELLQRFMQSK